MWGQGGGRCAPLSTLSHLIMCRPFQKEGGFLPCFFPADMLPFSVKHKQCLLIHLL